MKNDPIEQEQPDPEIPGWLAKLYGMTGGRVSKHRGAHPIIGPRRGTKGRGTHRVHFSVGKATNTPPRLRKAKRRKANKVARASRKINR